MIRPLKHILLSVTLLGLPLFSSPAQEAEGAPATEVSTSSWDQLLEIVQMAPGRQVGQPGNRAIDAWVEERFAAAAARNTGDGDGKEASRLLEELVQIDEQIADGWTQELLAEVVGPEPDLQLAPDWRLQLGNNQSVILILGGGILAALVLGWVVQRRTELLVVAAAVLVLGLGLLVLGVSPAAQLAHLQSEVFQEEDLLAARNELLQELETSSVQAWKHGRVPYPAPAFIPGSAELSLNGETIPLFPLAPNLFEPSNPPAGEISGLLVAVNQEFLDRAPMDALEGKIAVLPFDSGSAWVEAVSLGAKAILLLEPEDTSGMLFSQAIAKITNTPLSAPRYFVTRGNASETILANAFEPGINLPAAAIKQEPNRWVREGVAADWLFIPGRNASLAPVFIIAAKDGASVVPDLSPSATSASNLVVLDQLLNRFEKQPPERGVVLAAVNDRANALHGDRQFGFFAFAPQQAIDEELSRLNRMIAEALFLEQIFARPPDEETVQYLRFATERIGGRNFSPKSAMGELLKSRLNSIRDERRQIVQEENNADAEATIRRLDSEINRIVSMQSIFNKYVQRFRYKDMSSGDLELLADFFQEIHQQSKTNRMLLEAERKQILDGLRIRPRVSGPAKAEPSAFLPVPPLDTIAVICLDLSFEGGECGFFVEGGIQLPEEFAHRARSSQERVTRLARHALDVAAEIESADVFRDTILMSGGINWEGHHGTRLAIPSSAYQEFAVPAVSLMGVNDIRPRAFTPDDLPELLDRSSYERITSFCTEFLPALTSSEGLEITRVRRGNPEPLTIQLTTLLMDAFSVEIPRTPLPNAIVYGRPDGLQPRDALIRLGEISPYPFSISGETGRTTLRGKVWDQASAFVFGYGEDFQEVTSAVDFAEGDRRFSSVFAVGRNTFFAARPLIAFAARKTDLYGLVDPLSMNPVNQIELLDGNQDAAPRNYAIQGIGSLVGGKAVPLSFDGTGSVFIASKSHFKLKVAGAPVLNGTAEDPFGDGFPAGRPALRSVPSQSAEDMNRLTALRLNMLESRGVSDSTIQARHQEAVDLLSSEEGSPDLIDLLEAWSLSLQAYTMTLETMNDLVKAVVFLLALAIPFCYFVMKLLLPFTDVNRQIVGFIAVLLLLVAALFFIQPAFRISDRPMVVLLAFLIFGLAGFVGFIIYSRFDNSMRQTIRELAGGAAAKPAHGELAGVAFVVGVNNMKRRRVRTSLTCATVALVTFTMLSMISVQRTSDPVRILVSGETLYDGIMVMRPGMGSIHPFQARQLSRLFGPDYLSLSRTWTQRFDAFEDPLPYEVRIPETNDSIRLLTLLGLPSGELNAPGNEKLRDALLPGGNWFSNDQAQEIILIGDAPRFLGLTPENAVGQTVNLVGRPLTIVGVLSEEGMLEVKDLREMPLTPAKPEASLDAAREETTQQASGTFSSEDLLGGRDFAILPVETARSLGNTSARLLSIRHLKGGEPASASAWEKASRMVDFLGGRFTVGISEAVPREAPQPPVTSGQYILASADGTQLGGLMKVIIPTILGATILLNTMLGSVMERKRDISIYNSIGLNPTHVMVFFLAESLVFGLVGAFGGYLVGQVLSLGLSQVLDLNLNYSSLAVVAVIFLSVFTVLASTLYPAFMAAKSAVPSGQRKWSLPSPTGDLLSLQFPFLYTRDSITGVCAYLHDFLMQNSEASTGKFLARYLGVESGSGEEPSILRYTIAPSPFDLGVNQTMDIHIRKDDRLGAWILVADLERVSGERHNWTTVNQPFLESLREHLLLWRTIPKDRQKNFIETGTGILSGNHEPVNQA